MLIINISNSNNLNKYWVGIFTHQGRINQVYWRYGVSQSVSELVSDKHNQWSDSGPIKRERHLFLAKISNEVKRIK